MFNRPAHTFLLDDPIWAGYASNFRQMKVPAKTVLLKEGEIPKKMFLIEKGCIRAWFNNDGKDVSFQFFFENQMVASIESFRKRLPSPVTIETVEPSVVWFIRKKDAEKMISGICDIPEWRNRFIDAVFERTFDYMKHFFSFIKDSPLQRYQNLVRNKPWIVQRVPQHYIASYLGISTVHLSRIKSKLAREKQGA